MRKHNINSNLQSKRIMRLLETYEDRDFSYERAQDLERSRLNVIDAIKYDLVA